MTHKGLNVLYFLLSNPMEQFHERKIVDKIKRVSGRIVLFGSCDEGTDVKDSDIDLFTLTSDTETVQREVRLYEQKIDRRLSSIIIGSNELAKMKSRDKPLYERISRGITLWERE